MIEKQVAQALLEIGAVGFNFEQPITFKSGILSPVYVDNRRLPYHPKQWHIIMEGFKQVIESNALPEELIAGVAVGGIPHSATLGYLMNKPSVFVRKEAKEHGKQQLVEGGSVQDKQVLLVEDMVTTAGSALKAIRALRDEGAVVNHLVAIVSYGFEEATTNLTNEQIRLYTLTNFSVILEVTNMLGLLKSSEIDIVNEWLRNPYNWRKS
jgi:orotate phosphoribosyltransferase